MAATKNATVMKVGGVSISGLDKAVLLRALWDSTKPAAFYGSGMGPVFDEKGVSKAVLTKVDYYSGRLIDVDLSQDTIHNSLYERDSKKTLAQVVADVRAGTFQTTAIPPRKCPGCGGAAMALYKGYPVCNGCLVMFEQEPTTALLLFQH